MPVSTRETWKAWFAKKKAEADAAAAKEAAELAAYNTEKTAWDAARQGEVREHEKWKATSPGMREMKRKAEIWLAAHKKPKMGMDKPFMYGSTYDQLYNYYRNVSRENESTAHRYAKAMYAKYAPYKQALNKYENTLEQWQKTRKQMLEDAGIEIPDKPTIRGVFADRVIPPPPGPREIGAASAEAVATDPTTQYGAAFLKNYGADILGMSAGMTDLEKMMNLTDDYYSIGDLTTGSQASRDYFATNLWDYLQKNKLSGDYSAITETPALQNFIKDRLGLTWDNYDDLMESLSANYGYTRI